MSARSAHGRKKKPKSTKDKVLESNQQAASTDYDGVSDMHMNVGSVGTGIGTTNARFLKFSDNTGAQFAAHTTHPSNGGTWPRDPSIGSHESGGSGADPRAGYAHQGTHDNIGYPEFGRQTTTTEDVSGIERSGLRSIIDKKSDGVRKGLAKTFAFRKKGKAVSATDNRPSTSSATYQGHHVPQRPGMLHQGHEGSFTAQLPNTSLRQPSNYTAPLSSLDQQPVPPLSSPHRWPLDEDVWGSGAVAPPPTGKLPPVPQSQGPYIKRWVGAGRPVERWNNLLKDPELWDPNGDVLIFLSPRSLTPSPAPSFRLSSHIIEATQSRHLANHLQQGFVGDSGASISSGDEPGHEEEKVRTLDYCYNPSIVAEELTDGQVSYEIYFPVSPHLSKKDQLRHQITTRNLFALIYHASLVGVSLHQSLVDLHIRLDAIMPPDSDNVGLLINYLSARGIDDVRSDAETAISLLAWSEKQDVHWEEGWRECFIHCVGMYNELEECADYKATTPITRALLERTSLEMQLRLQAAEERLADFAFDDMWPDVGPAAHSSARLAAGRLERMLARHYARVYGTWPPPVRPSRRMTSNSRRYDEDLRTEELWLSREIVARLQRDLGALYDYLVNRDIMWDMSEARSGRKWLMFSKSGNACFNGDTMEVPMTDLLIEFDNLMRYEHIPHPFPHVPESISGHIVHKSKAPGHHGNGLYIARSNVSSTPSSGSRSGSTHSGGRAGVLERQIQLAYTESTNIYVLDSDFAQNDLVDAFTAFEKTDMISETDPALARMGRWITIYGMLQTLASVSVDAPRLRYSDGVRYHMCPRLKDSKIVPWKGAAIVGEDDGGHNKSYCWRTVEDWESGGSDDNSDDDSYGEEESEANFEASGMMAMADASDRDQHRRWDARVHQPLASSNKGGEEEEDDEVKIGSRAPEPTGSFLQDEESDEDGYADNHGTYNHPGKLIRDFDDSM